MCIDYNPHHTNRELAQWIPFVIKIDPDTKGTNKWTVQEFNDVSTLPEDATNVYELTVRPRFKF